MWYTIVGRTAAPSFLGKKICAFFFEKMLDKLLKLWYNRNFGPGVRARAAKNQVVKVYKKSPQNGAKFLTHKQSVLSLNLGVIHVFGGEMLSGESVLGQEVRTIIAILVELAESIFHGQCIVFIVTGE